MNSDRDMDCPDCPDDVEWFDQFPSGVHDHPRAECESLWDRIYRRWKDERLCQWWWDRRRLQTIEAWIHAFKTVSEKEYRLAKEGIKLDNLRTQIMMCAVGYDKNPVYWKKVDEAKDKQTVYQESLPKVVVLTDEKRAHWNASYARQKAKASASSK